MKKLGLIEITENEVAEFDRNRKIVAIPKDQIEEISLEYGFSEERPITSIVIGFLLLLLGIGFGLIPIMGIILQITNDELVGGSRNFGVFAFAIPLLFLGAWFVFKTFKYRHFLKVVTSSNTRKLPFGKSIAKASIESYVKECNRAFGYNILLKNCRKH
jgi:hypothetical protein